MPMIGVAVDTGKLGGRLRRRDARSAVGGAGTTCGTGGWRWLALLLTSIAFSVQPSEGQTVLGSVVDNDTRGPIAGAEIFLVSARSPSPPMTTTNSLGRFELSLPHGGNHTLQVTHADYADPEPLDLEVAEGETVTVEIRASASAIPLEPMVVTARSQEVPGGFQERRMRRSGRFITREDVEARGASRTSDLFRGVAGISLQPVRRGSRDLIFMRGSFGRCEPAIWLDNHLVEQASSSSLDDFLSPESVAGIEIYGSASEAPTQYVTGPCGAIVIWTRRGTRGENGTSNWKEVLGGAAAAVTLLILFVN